MGCGASKAVLVREAEEESPPNSPDSNFGSSIPRVYNVGWGGSAQEVRTPYMDSMWKLRTAALNSTTSLKDFASTLSFGPRELQAAVVAFTNLAGPIATRISVERLGDALGTSRITGAKNTLLRRFIASFGPEGADGLSFKAFAICLRIFKVLHPCCWKSFQTSEIEAYDCFSSQVDVASSEKLRYWFFVMCTDGTSGSQSSQLAQLTPEDVAPFLKDAICGMASGISASQTKSGSKVSARTLEKVLKTLS